MNIDAIMTVAELKKPLEELGFTYRCGHNISAPGYVKLMGITEGILRVRPTPKLGKTILEYKLPDSLSLRYEYDSKEKLIERIKEIIAENCGE